MGHRRNCTLIYGETDNDIWDIGETTITNASMGNASGGAKEQKASCATRGHWTRRVLGASGVDGIVEVRRGTGCCRFEVSCEVRRFISLDKLKGRGPSSRVQPLTSSFDTLSVVYDIAKTLRLTLDLDLSS